MKKRIKQLPLDAKAEKKMNRSAHGGKVLKGQRKEARPFDHKRPIHVVLKSSLAKGDWSFLIKENKKYIEKLLSELCKKYNIKLYQFAVVGNHLHLEIKVLDRKRFIAKWNFQCFLKRFTGAIAMFITGSRKGNPVKNNGRKRRFWDYLAYSRLLTWGREFNLVRNYLVGNIFEGAGLWNRKRNPAMKVITLICRETGLSPPEGQKGFAF